MAKIIGAENMTDAQLQWELERGGKLVFYQYVYSLLVVTFKRSSDVYFIPAGADPVSPGWRYTLLSLVVGWWGIPWGFIYTPSVIYKNLKGGTDVTAQVLAKLGNVAPSRGAAGMQPVQPARPMPAPVVVPPAAPPAVGDLVLSKRTYQWPDRLGYYATFSSGGQQPLELEVPKDWYDYLQPQMRGRLQLQGNAFVSFDVL